MDALPRCKSRNLYSWWWDSHISPTNSNWLKENLADMDSKVKTMIKLIQEDGDTFARRAELYFEKRPQLMNLVEEFYRAYRALAERYDCANVELRQAHRSIIDDCPTEELNVAGDDKTPQLLNQSSSQTSAFEKILVEIQAEKEKLARKYHENFELLFSMELELNDARCFGVKSRTEVELNIFRNILKRLEAEMDGNRSSDEAKDYVEMISMLQDQISASEVEAKRLMIGQKTAEKNDVLECENKSLKEKLETLTQSIIVRDEELKALQNLLHHEKLRLSEAESSFVALHKVHQKYQDDQKSLTIELKKKLELVIYQDLPSSSYGDAIDKLKNEKRTLERDLAFLLAQSSALHKEISTMNTKYEDEHAKLRIVCEEKIVLTEKLQKLEKALYDTVQESGERIEAMRIEKSELIAERAILLSEMNRDHVELENLRSRTKFLEEHSQKSKDGGNNLENERSSCLSQLENVGLRMRNLETRFSNMEVKCNDLEINVLQKFIEDLEFKNMSLQLECRKFAEFSKFSRKMMTEIEEANNEQREEIEFLMNELEKLRTERVTLSSSLKNADDDTQLLEIENLVLLSILDQKKVEDSNFLLLHRKNCYLEETNMKMKLELTRREEKEILLNAELVGERNLSLNAKNNTELALQTLYDMVIMQEVEIAALRMVNEDVESEIEELLSNEVKLGAEFEEIKEEEFCDVEAPSYFFDLQASFIREAVIDDDVHAIAPHCDYLEEMNATEEIDIDTPKDFVVLDNEKKVLKIHQSPDAPPISFLRRSIDSTERISQEEVHQQVLEGEGFFQQPPKRGDDELAEDGGAAFKNGSHGCIDESSLSEVIEKVMITEKNPQPPRSKSMKGLLEESKLRGPNDMSFGSIFSSQIWRDNLMPLDHASDWSSTRYSHMFEDWAHEIAHVSRKNSMVLSKSSLRNRSRTGKHRQRNSILEFEIEEHLDYHYILERLESDAMRLISSKLVVEDLTRKLETKKWKKVNTKEIERLKNVLVEVEEKILQLFGWTNQLARDIESAESNVMVVDGGDSSCERRMIAERTMKGSEMIGCVQFEVESMQYSVSKLISGNKSKGKGKFLGRGILLKQFIKNK